MARRPVPARVESARSRAALAGFELSSDDGVGALLAALSAAVRPRGTIVELGTGVGVGLAWIVHGLTGRDDVSVYSVDTDDTLLETTAAVGWPDYVHFVAGDGARVVSELAPIDLVFADAPGGKIHGLENTIDALRAGALLVVDDMDLRRHERDGLEDDIAHVHDVLVTHPQLVTAVLDYSSGVMLSTKRVDTSDRTLQ
jgi:predicted O-methyltransferase YrrM